jgi:hypothetical protein
MAKKESLNKTEGEAGAQTPAKSSGRIAAFAQKVFGIIKFALGVCLLPFIYSTSRSFLNEFVLVESSLQRYFWSGAITFLIIYLFVWEPVTIYAKGQKLLELIFSFFKPLVRVAPYLLPIYTIVLFVAYLIISPFIKSAAPLHYTLFLTAFTAALHLVFSAKSLRSKQGDFLKGNYIFGFSFLYILDLFIASLFLNFIFDKFSFVAFANNSFNVAAGIFVAIFKQLFLT